MCLLDLNFIFQIIVSKFASIAFSIKVKHILRPLCRNKENTAVLPLNLSHLKISVHCLIRIIVLSHAAAETWGKKFEFRAHRLWGYAAICWSKPVSAGINHGLQYDMVETTDFCLHLIEICEHKLLIFFIYLFIFVCLFVLKRSVSRGCCISLHRASMEITSNEKWSQQPTQLCSDL